MRFLYKISLVPFLTFPTLFYWILTDTHSFFLLFRRIFLYLFDLSSDDVITGDIYIGAGETEAVHFLTRTARQMQKQYPQVHFHISSGDTADVIDQLDKGLIDFGLLLGEIDDKNTMSSLCLLMILWVSSCAGMTLWHKRNM